MNLPEIEIVEAVDRACRRTAAVVHAELQSGLKGLATVASLAPFVALLGTLVGIANSFVGCGAAKSTCTAAHFERLAMALVPTVLGFVVAIPAWLGYKYLTGQLEVLDLEMEDTSARLASYLRVYLALVSA